MSAGFSKRGGYMPHLSQCLGVEKNTRVRTQRAVTGLYRIVQAPESFNGLNRTYTPRDDDGDELPPEVRHVQYKVDDILSGLRAALTELFDTVATKEWGNTKARADIVVDGETVLPDVPVTYLLFLEKQLNDIQTFFRDLPILDQNEIWEQDRGDGFYRSEVAETLKMKKVPRNHVKAEATDKHPAQVDTYYEDVPVGSWRRVLRSGAVPHAQRDALCRRVIKLRDAVIAAREAANTIQVNEIEVGSTLFNYLLGRP
jgi:hypothetical protein